MELKKEAEFFRDIVIVPYVDNYDLVVLKTIAICEYGVSCELINNLRIEIVSMSRLMVFGILAG